MTKLMQLDPTNYKDGLYTLVSDPSLVGSARRTKRLAINDIPAMPRVWDITPIVTPPTTPDLEIVDTFQLNVGSQNALSIDPASPLITVGGQPIYKHGCAKTNINLAMLNDGDTWHVGLRAIVASGYTFSRVDFYDTNVDATEYATYALHQLTNSGAAPSNQLVLSADRSAANLSIAGMMYNPVTQSYHYIGGGFPMKYDVDTNGSDNTTALMLLHRDGNTLNVTIAAVDMAGNYDINEVNSIGNDNFPFDFSSLTMFLYLGTVTSPSMEYQQVVPTITTGLPDYDVAFTKYETSGGSQSAFDALFPVEAHRPSGVLVQQAVFPEGVRVGELLNVYVDSQYTGPNPAPYGMPLLSGQTVMVTANSSEGKSVDRMIRQSEYEPLVQAVNGLTTGGGVSLPYGEIVVYVNNELDSVDLFTGDRAFSTFDLAYEYLIGLSSFIPKRIVLDDRPIAATGPNYFVGIIGKLYQLGANNIKLSTYCAFSGEPYPKYYNSSNEHRPDPDINPWLYLRDMSFDSLHLIDFWGTFIQNQNAEAHVWLGGSIPTQSSPSTLRAANLRLGKNTAVYATEGTVDYYDGGDILLEDDAFLKLHFSLYKGGVNETPLNLAPDIHKSAKARLYITAFGNDYQTSLPLSGHLHQMTVYKPVGGLDVEFPSNNGSIAAIVDVVEVNYNYAPVFTIDNVVMVRNLVDFKPDYDYNGVIVLPQIPTTFFIVGEVNLDTHTLYGGTGDAKHHFMGFPDSRLIADNHILSSNSINSNQSFKFTGIELKTTSVAAQQAVIHMESGGLEIDNCKIDSPAGIRYIANAIPSAATAWPISIKSTEFTSQVRSPGSMIRINSYCNVLLRDVIHSGDVFPQQPLMDLRGQSQTAHLIIDGFTVVGNDEPLTSPLFVIDSLPRSNGSISVRGVHMTHGSVNDNRSVFFGLFTLDYLGTNVGYYTPYDNSQDNRIVTDRSSGFMLYKAQYGNVIAVDDTETDYIVNLHEERADVCKKYGFLSEAGGAQTYLLNEHKLYEIRLKCNIATSPGLTFEVKIKRIDDPFDEEHWSDFVTAVTDNSGQAWVDATYYRTMVGGGTYALAVRNVTQPTNFSLTDIVLTIREF